MNHDAYEIIFFNLISCTRNDIHISYSNNLYAILVTDTGKELKAQLPMLSLCM